MARHETSAYLPTWQGEQGSPIRQGTCSPTRATLSCPCICHTWMRNANAADRGEVRILHMASTFLETIVSMVPGFGLASHERGER